jgi:hypothetical protein
MKKPMILATMREAERVQEEAGLKSRVIIVHHLPTVIRLDYIQYLNKELKIKILEIAEKHLLDFCTRNREYLDCFFTLALENVFPKYFTNSDDYATINMFHPLEMFRLRNYEIKLLLIFLIITYIQIICCMGKETWWETLTDKFMEQLHPRGMNVSIFLQIL